MTCFWAGIALRDEVRAPKAGGERVPPSAELLCVTGATWGTAGQGRVLATGGSELPTPRAPLAPWVHSKCLRTERTDVVHRLAPLVVVGPEGVLPKSTKMAPDPWEAWGPNQLPSGPLGPQQPYSKLAPSEVLTKHADKTSVISKFLPWVLVILGHSRLKMPKSSALKGLLPGGAPKSA